MPSFEQSKVGNSESLAGLQGICLIENLPDQIVNIYMLNPQERSQITCGLGDCALKLVCAGDARRGEFAIKRKDTTVPCKLDNLTSPTIFLDTFDS